jgi:3-hydroxyisobutyrate dehydrogenase-like beta-hydroxyacid dehydrogenase
MSGSFPKRIAVVGLGAIGWPVCRNLAEDHPGLRAFDFRSDPEKTAELTARGASFEKDASGAASGADLLVLILPDSAATEHVLFEQGAAAALAPSAVCLDLTSGYPDDAKRFAAQLADTGRHYIDAPICNGGVGGAYERKIVLCAGGDADQLARVQPVLARVTSAVLPCGPVGSGAAAKIINNSMMEAFWAAICEGLATAKAYGFDEEAFARTMKRCSVSNPQFALIADKCLAPDANKSTFRLALGAKDLRYAARLAGDLGVAHGVTDAAFSVYQAAVAALGPDAESWTAPFRAAAMAKRT